MAYKEWEPDEFLDDLLDFDYKHPVPEQGGKRSKGLPAEEVTQSQQKSRNYGLGNEESGSRSAGHSQGISQDSEYKLYEELRRGNGDNAGKQAAGAAGTQDLRSSGAPQFDILEPLSARRKPESAPAGQENKSFNASVPERAKPDITDYSAGARSGAAPAPVEVEDRAVKTASSGGFLSKFKAGRKQIHASELATEAIDAARKLVHSDEDTPPETVPAAAAIPEISSIKGTAKPVQEKDELAELLAELDDHSDRSLTSEDNEALKQAQQDAYDRYRGNYNKKLKKNKASGRAGFIPRWLSRIYVVALAAFAVIMTVMNVLPMGMLVAFYIVLGLLSIIILFHLRKRNVHKGVRVMASVTALILIAGFGIGSAYAMGTLSFLDNTSVQNDSRVASVTKEPFNVCITGIDVNGKIDEQGRSDVNMIVTVNPKTEQILMTSIPRDYQIYMPDKDNAMDKLTHTGFYSVETTIGAEENLLDTKINYYVKVNFTTVKMFIDAIGGIDVYSEYEFTPVKKKDWTVQKGWNHMDGKQALAFARERKAFLDGDNQRIKNQQAVFEAIIKKATSSKTMLLSYNKMLNNLRDYFRMSFSSGELRSLLKLQLAKDPEWKIYRNTIRGGDGSLPTYTTGNAYAYVMTQDEDSINNAKELINAVLEGKMLATDDDKDVYVVKDESGEDGEAGIDGEADGE